MIVKHPRLASMSLQTEELREIAKTVCDNVILDSDSSATTAVTHYPDGRIEMHCSGDASAFADAINNKASYPDDVEAVQR